MNKVLGTETSLLAGCAQTLPDETPTCVSSRHSRKCVTLLKLRTELKTIFFFLGPIFSDNIFLKNFKLP